jgi:hypothetical protein
MKRFVQVLALTFTFVSISACAPKVYVIDRATILEEESGGTWPNVDQAQRQKLLKTSPTAQKTSDRSGQKEKLTRILEPDESVSGQVSGPSTNAPTQR